MLLLYPGLVLALLAPLGAAAEPAALPATMATPLGMASVGPGELRLAYPVAGEPDVVTVPAFFLDKRPVNNADMLAFVRALPKWQRDRVAGVYADERYLAHWAGPLELGPATANNRPGQPLTHVSWFAARAYCAWRDLRLPREREWELAAVADTTRADAGQDPAFVAQILGWYSRAAPAVMPLAGSGPANFWGISDLHGLVWEWVEDWNSTMVTGDNRDNGNVDKSLFCGAGAISAKDVSDYATFMRFAYRSSLGARFTTKSLGFRCARDLLPKVVQ